MVLAVHGGKSMCAISRPTMSTTPLIQWMVESLSICGTQRMSVLPNGDARLDYAQIYGFRHTQKSPIITDDTHITSLPFFPSSAKLIT